MPKNEVSDPITDQEIAFALLVLSGAMTDRQAAESAGLPPDSAAYTKAKPSVRAYMLEHRAAMEQQLVQQDTDLSRLQRLSRPAVERVVGGAAEQLCPLSPNREQVLARLWELAHLSPEMTRNSITGQVKAISMIVAMQNFIPDRRAEKKSAPAPEFAPRSATDAPPNPNPSHSTFAKPFSPSEVPPLYIPRFSSIPDLGVPLSTKNLLVRPR